jgi:hypothetical protein
MRMHMIIRYTVVYMQCIVYNIIHAPGYMYANICVLVGHFEFTPHSGLHGRVNSIAAGDTAESRAIVGQLNSRAIVGQ